jgi:AcrR family transcriptional regulator
MNRQRLLSAARDVFAEQGLNVSMRQIALRAGVSEPTLRRRFASKEDLVVEAFEDKIKTYADLAEAALDMDDPWAGFTSLLRQMALMQLVDRGFAEVLTMTFPPSMRYEQERRRAYDATERLIRKAKEAGRLRDDFVAEDIVLVLLAHAGVVAGAGPLAERLSARLLGYALQAFATPGDAELPAPPSGAEVYRALLRLHQPRDARRD